MKSSKFYLSAFLISVIFIAAVFMACGGSGGGTSSGSAPASGSVAVMLTDGPYEGLENLFITITKVSLLRADNGREVVVFDDPGLEVDILSYREYNYLLTVNQEVPVGTYSKVRLEVSDVRAVGGDCAVDGIEIKLPSGKIDLNPRGTFQVVEGEALAIRLDIDAKKSFLLHTAGNSGKCIFRPVIFVDIKPVDMLDSCPEVLKGRIVSLEYDSNRSVIGFFLDLNRGDLLQVSIATDTVIFDENGLPGDKSDIELRKPAYVRGRIQSDGSLLASLVVIGDVLKVKGTATEAVAVVAGQDQYTMTLDPYQELVGDSVEVGLASATIILIDCDTPVPLSYIRQGVRTTVIGKYDTGNRVLRAVVVIVEPREITGRLTNIDTVTNIGSNLTITLADSTETVFLPYGQKIYLQGDGVVDLDRLKGLYGCSNIQVRVLVDPAQATTPPTTKKVYVIPDQETSIVKSVGTNTILLESGYTIDVETDAKIIKKTDGSYFHIELSAIQQGNEVTVFGLDNCNNPNHFYGYIVVVED
jgi:hypothetical protein